MYNGTRNVTQIIANLIALLLHWYQSLSKKICKLQHFPTLCFCTTCSLIMGLSQDFIWQDLRAINPIF